MNAKWMVKTMKYTRHQSLEGFSILYMFAKLDVLTLGFNQYVIYNFLISRGKGKSKDGVNP